MLRRDGIGLRSQAVPEVFVRFHGIARIEAFEKEFFQFLLVPLEVWGSESLDGRYGGVQRFLRGALRACVDDGTDSLLLFVG